MTVLVDRLNEKMKSEGIDKNILDSVTRRGFYDSLVSGSASDKDIQDAADLLRCKVVYLTDTRKGGGRKPGVSIDPSRIKSRREKMGYSVACLADVAGMSAMHLTALGARKRLSEPYLVTLAYALECSVEYLTGKSDDIGTKPAKQPIEFQRKSRYSNISGEKMKLIMEAQNLSPHCVAEKIGLPVAKVRSAMVSGVIAESAMKRFCSITNTTESDLKNCTRIKSANSLTKVHDDNLRQKKADDEARKELASKIPQMVGEYKERTVNASLPVNGMISTGQLLSLAIITEKHPELLKLFSQVAQLEESDYNKLYNTVQWMVDTLTSK